MILSVSSVGTPGAIPKCAAVSSSAKEASWSRMLDKINLKIIFHYFQQRFLQKLLFMSSLPISSGGN
jgi:hypothetical protein